MKNFHNIKKKLTQKRRKKALCQKKKENSFYNGKKNGTNFKSNLCAKIFFYLLFLGFITYT